MTGRRPPSSIGFPYTTKHTERYEQWRDLTVPPSSGLAAVGPLSALCALRAAREQLVVAHRRGRDEYIVLYNTTARKIRLHRNLPSMAKERTPAAINALIF